MEGSLRTPHTTNVINLINMHNYKAKYYGVILSSMFYGNNINLSRSECVIHVSGSPGDMTFQPGSDPVYALDGRIVFTLFVLELMDGQCFTRYLSTRYISC